VFLQKLSFLPFIPPSGPRSITQSAAAFNINILDEVGLITTQFESGNRGTKKR